jgi:cytochrome P450
VTVDTHRPSVFDAGLPTIHYDLADPPSQVYPKLRAAQQQAPIAIGPFGPEILSYELVRDTLRDNSFRVSPGINLMAQGITSGPLWDKVANSLLCMEPDAHQRLRKLVSKAFTPRATGHLNATIVEVINGLVDDVAEAGRCDIVQDIARPYPVPIICALLGAPREDWQQFSAWTDDIFEAFSFYNDVAAAEPSIMRAWNELDDYVDDMVAERRHSLTDDLLSELIRAEDADERLDAAELRMLAAGLLMAGTDTTRNQLASSVALLCEHPEQWALLREQPEYAMGAVEETMRHSPAVCFALRTATNDVTLGEFVVPAGTSVFLSTYAANLDPAVYDDPDRLDITRTSTPAIQTFGGGAHYCLGANLARLELAEALKVLTQRMPEPHLTGPAPWKPMVGMTGPTSLPVAFNAAGASRPVQPSAN